MKILVLSLAGVGDTLMATPLLHELRLNYPAASIEVLVMWKSSRSVLENNPHIDRVHAFNMIQEGAWKTFKFCRALGARGYDVSINTYPQGKVAYRIVARLIGAKIRLSHDYENWGALDRFLVHQTRPQDYTRHCIENNLELLDLLGATRRLTSHAYELYPAPNAADWSERFFAENDLGGRMLIGFHVGSGATKNLALRRWPLEFYRELALKLLDWNSTATLLLLGGPEEERDNLALAALAPKRILLVKTPDIRDSAVMLRKCHAFLSVDTAMMHLAACARVPRQFVIETPTLNDTVLPYGGNFQVVRNPGITRDKLSFYRYDGKAIKAGDRELARIMRCVTAESVFRQLVAALDSGV